jgi:hypothetical protein
MGRRPKRSVGPALDHVADQHGPLAIRDRNAEPFTARGLNLEAGRGLMDEGDAFKVCVRGDALVDATVEARVARVVPS